MAVENNDAESFFLCNDLSTKSLLRMFEFQKAGDLCDVVLVAGGGRRIPTHKLVLLSASNYFRRILIEDETIAEINVEHLDGDSVHDLMAYCYTAKLEIRRENVETLKEAAEEFLFPNIVRICEEFQLSLVRRNLSRKGAMG